MALLGATALHKNQPQKGAAAAGLLQQGHSCNEQGVPKGRLRILWNVHLLLTLRLTSSSGSVDPPRENDGQSGFNAGLSRSRRPRGAADLFFIFVFFFRMDVLILEEKGKEYLAVEARPALSGQ